MITKVKQKLVSKFYQIKASSNLASLNQLIMGKRPYNTVFSFNYHNISHIVRFLRSAHVKIPSKQNIILDVGAGSSPYYEIFQSIASKYIVVDMKEALPHVENRPIDQKVGFAEDLPIDSESVDIVLSNQVLEHVLDERKAVAESFRVLKKGGYFVGSVPHLSPIHLEPYDFRRFTYYGLKKLFEDNGFEILEIEGNGGVHSGLALTLTMDWFLSKHKTGESQKFFFNRHLLLFPLTGFINVSAIIADKLIGNKLRSPSNYCWIARKN